MADEEILRRLDTTISLLKLAHQDALGETRARALKDDVTAGLLEATANDYVGSGELKKNIGKATNQSEKTVQRRIGDLVAMGALGKRPTGQAAYRSTEVI